MASTMLSSKASVCTPFRSGQVGRPSLACRSSRSSMVERVPRKIVAASEAEPKKLSQAAIAAFAAGCIALSGPAFATESGIMPNRNRDEDNAARSFLESKESDRPAVQSRSDDPNSGKVDTVKVGSTSQADSKQPAGRYPMKGPNEKASLDEQVENLSPTRGNANSEAAKQLDPKQAIKAANDRSVAPVAFNPAAASSLQVNVVFGTGEVGTTKDQINEAADDAKDALSNPGRSAENTASNVQRVANKTLVNPAGEEQSKEAADKVSDANAQVPQAIQKGFTDLKNQLTQPSSFKVFDTPSLLHTTKLQVGDSRFLQHDVRVGDLSSISGGQAKKAGPDEVSQPSSRGDNDAQLITNESTSGVKARGADNKPSEGGAAERAAKRVDQLTNDKTLVP